MTKTVGLITYPDTIERMQNDANLIRAFAEFTSSAEGKKYQIAMRYVTSDASPSVRYSQFFSHNASSRVKLSKGLQAMARNAKETGNWDDPDYAGVIDFVMQAYTKELNRSGVKAFFTSQAFKEFHSKKICGAAKLKTRAEAAAKELNLSKHKAEVIEIFAQAAFGSASAMRAAAKKLENTGGISNKIRGKKRDVIKELKDKNYLRVTP